MNKRTLIALFACAVIACGSVQNPRTSGQKGTGAKKAGAAQKKPGKKYVERNTPFGKVKVDEQQAAPPREPELTDVRITEEGDSVRFERRTPFGISRWLRKKSELTAEERAAWQKSLPGNDGAGKQE